MPRDPTARQVADMIARYTPEIADAITACRRKLCARVPRGYELVYDSYNALAIGYAWADQASASLVSIAAYPRWVTLFFLYGQGLPDPEGLLEGDGVRVRSLRLGAPEDLDRPAVQQLLELALAPHAADFAAAPPLQTVVKAVAAKRRERRPA
ncbi:MAG: DUF1801 domain-containing protein [Roseateles sp.]|jgi:hypothetical protein|nr:DUF1801 domain-containing protein [Burkholderiaceae bacterium]|mmetsp:Transcript_33908/g.79391  ORF Transcript_33908/g.79391 Transcript_33908/m.79391 type:complete len:153 (-) Transcript_33908:2997-3455(-)